MRFGKGIMFLLLNGIIAFFLVLYFCSWLISKQTIASTISPYYANTINVQYQVIGKVYYGNYMRNDVPYSQKNISILYWAFDPSVSKVYSFMGLAAEPLAWWLVFLLASAMLLLMNNTVFSKGTIFQLHKKFPWISMDEYFPAAGNWWHTKEENFPKKIRQKKLGNKKEEDSKTLSS
jgi:hypothetical protein